MALRHFEDVFTGGPSTVALYAAGSPCAAGEVDGAGLADERFGAVQREFTVGEPAVPDAVEVVPQAAGPGLVDGGSDQAARTLKISRPTAYAALTTAPA